MSRNEKKSKFVAPKKSKTGTYVAIGIIVAAVIAVGAFVATQKSSGSDSQVNVGAMDYSSSQKVDFAKVQASDASGNITIDLNQVKNQKAVTFDVQGINFQLANGTPFNYVPLLAFVDPKGNVVVATSLCEPCSGTTFHIEGGNLVCNSCGTQWTLDGLKGVGGGCTQYPPETVKYTVDGSKLIIKKADLQNWKPRQV